MTSAGRQLQAPPTPLKTAGAGVRCPAIEASGVRVYPSASPAGSDRKCYAERASWREIFREFVICEAEMPWVRGVSVQD